jgi:Fur family ferric uptake transcriptional regulator
MSRTTQELATQMLASNGQRMTPKREAIVHILSSAVNPLTIAEIVTRSASEQLALAQSSVYRNLAVLEAADVVRKVVAVDEFGRFELSEVLSGHHHHLLCTVCGQVEDVELDAEVEAELDRALATLAAARGYEIDHHRFDGVGRCRMCAGVGG